MPRAHVQRHGAPHAYAQCHAAPRAYAHSHAPLLLPKKQRHMLVHDHLEAPCQVQLPGDLPVLRNL